MKNERTALKPLADAMNLEVAEYWEQILEEWGMDSSRTEFWLPNNFRKSRAIYELKFPLGWWIDLTATESISALHTMFGSKWDTSKGRTSKVITRSDLESDDRVLTTSIASEIRRWTTLDDGTRPLGVRFDSKHGAPAGESGACWAYWMRGKDAGFTERVEQVSENPIDAFDIDLLRAQRLSGLRMR